MQSKKDNSSNQYGVGILGVTGYTGGELLRLLLQHPQAAVRGVSARQFAGQPAAAALPALPFLQLQVDDDATSPQAWRDRGIDVVFSCLPHGAFAARAAAFLQAGMKVIDLSADFRLTAPELYPVHYGLQHPAPELLGEAVYGLCEWNDIDLTAVRLVANPGCYATAILLALLPAAAAGLIAPAPIVVTAMSGVSGAGRGLKLGSLFGECGGSVAPYKVGDQHAHLGEIGQMLARHGVTSPVVFNPHLVPMARGIAATVAIQLADRRSAEEVRALYAARYAGRPFVQILGADALPETRFVRGSNRCDLAVRCVVDGDMLLVFAALDNLVKGAAGQAVQNFNRMLGLGDETGLSAGAMACA